MTESGSLTDLKGGLGGLGESGNLTNYDLPYMRKDETAMGKCCGGEK